MRLRICCLICISTWYLVKAMVFITTSSSSSSRTSNNRYFTQHSILPRLDKMESSWSFSNETTSLPTTTATTTSTVPYSEYTGREIPVVYTNDPKSVYSWFTENLSTNGCVVGFDVEVSCKEIETT